MELLSQKISRCFFIFINYATKSTLGTRNLKYSTDMCLELKINEMLYEERNNAVITKKKLKLMHAKLHRSSITPS